MRLFSEHLVSKKRKSSLVKSLKIALKLVRVIQMSVCYIAVQFYHHLSFKPLDVVKLQSTSSGYSLITLLGC